MVFLSAYLQVQVETLIYETISYSKKEIENRGVCDKLDKHRVEDPN